MRRARWLAPWKNDVGRPTIYHVISRVVDRRFVFEIKCLTLSKEIDFLALIFILPLCDDHG